MEINGREIAREIKKQVRKEINRLSEPIKLSIIYVGNDPVVENFLRIKEKVGQYLGVEMLIERFEEKVSLEDIVKKIDQLQNSREVSGIIIQLPLPERYSLDDKNFLLNTVLPKYDVDVLSDQAMEDFRKGTFGVTPPVIGAIEYLVFKYNLDFRNKKVVVLGKGRLVGSPAIIWLEKQGIEPIVIDSRQQDRMVEELKKADLIISGVGRPNLIKPDMIKNGVVIMDAGASSTYGRLLGDADSQCSEKASFFTPVPGGIGPITVACLFKNLLVLHKRDHL